MARTSRANWLDEGLALLREGGDRAVTIEALCQRLARTKGSYYHHFGEADGYFVALLGHWETKQTGEPINVAEKDRSATVAERRRRLRRFVMNLDMGLENAVRAWALHDGRARDAVTRVDERRITYLATLNEEEGLPKGTARALAQLEYATFVGAQQLYPDLHGTEAQLLLETLRRALRGLRT